MLAPNFSDLAPALVITAEMDPLRDEGEVYYQKLKSAGNRAELMPVAGMPHTFVHLDGILEGGQRYNERVIETIRRELLQ